MTQFIEGLDRQQTTLLPDHLGDYVDENSSVRTVDAFADNLDLAALGFIAQPAGYCEAHSITAKFVCGTRCHSLSPS